MNQEYRHLLKVLLLSLVFIWTVSCATAVDPSEENQVPACVMTTMGGSRFIEKVSVIGDDNEGNWICIPVDRKNRTPVHIKKEDVRFLGCIYYDSIDFERRTSP